MSSIAAAAFSGFLTCAALIVAIGAQNLFVLRQGLEGRHVAPVVLFCGLADTALISAGVAGAGSTLALVPGFARGLTLAGAAFLICYGAAALRRAIATNALIAAAAVPCPSVRQALTRSAAFTFLNPHVYLDSVLLMGSAGASHPVGARPVFVAGAAIASFSWFALIGFGARKLAPLFAMPEAWRIVDALVGAALLALATGLLRQALSGG